MTRTTNARLAGFTYLFYIAVGITSMILYGRATGGQGTVAKLASIAQHLPDVRGAVLLSMLGSFSALVLGVTLYGVTRDEDHEIAMLGLAFRVGEGVIGAIGLQQTLGTLWLATAGTAAGGPDGAAASALGAYLLMPGSSLGATFFAVGSTAFCYLLLRGRMIPAALAWLGVLASALLVVALPLELVGLLEKPFTSFLVMWMPMLVFELTVATWLLVKGVAPVRSMQRG